MVVRLIFLLTVPVVNHVIRFPLLLPCLLLFFTIFVVFRILLFYAIFFFVVFFAGVFIFFIFFFLFLIFFVVLFVVYFVFIFSFIWFIFFFFTRHFLLFLPPPPSASQSSSTSIIKLPRKVKLFYAIGELGWRGGESTRLPPLGPGPISFWIEFVGSLIFSERYFPGTQVFPSSLTTELYFICYGNRHGRLTTTRPVHIGETAD